ncbi:MAG: hypothetical protein ACLQK4_04275 [Acidimicrobiales bacterium]|jgi:hypothetical protein
MGEPALVEECRRAWERFGRPWRRPGNVACEQVASDLPAILDGGAEASGVLVAHVEYCLRCQAEIARYRKLLRLLHQVRSSDVAVPAGVVADVLSSLENAASRQAIRSVLTGRRIAYSSAVLAAVGTGTTLVVFALARSRAENGERRTQGASL